MLFEGEQLLDFLELCLRGYTVGRIRELMADRGWDLSAIPDFELIKMMRSSDEQIQADRVELDARIGLDCGMYNKLERVRRLWEAAEKIEGSANLSPKWSAEYRRYIEQIQRELEPLGLIVNVGDTWAALLDKLAKVGHPNVDKSNAPAEGSNTSTIGNLPAQ